MNHIVTQIHSEKPTVEEIFEAFCALYIEEPGEI